MRKIISIILILIFICNYYSCSDGSLRAEQYQQWVENEKNKLIQKQLINDYQIILQYEPLEYIVVKESQGKNVSKELLKKRTSELTGFTYFDLKILNSKNQNAFNNEAKTNKNYHLFDMQKDFCLIINNNDTVGCCFYLYESHGGVSPDEILLGFENSNIDGFTLMYNADILGIGKIKFNYNKEILQRIPKLKTR